MKNKRLILFLFLSFQMIRVNAQAYINIVDTGKTWSTLYGNDTGTGWINQTGIYSFDGDTTINILSYQKLYVSVDTLANDLVLYGAMRESDNKVFFYDLTTNVEMQIYDFGLIPGDTLTTLTFGPTSCALILESVDTIVLMNNEERKHYVFLLENTTDCINFNFSDAWIEGIGSMKDLLPNYIITQQICCDQEELLLCFTENGVLKYQNGFYETCFISNVHITEYSEMHTLTVFPNPADDIVYLSETQANNIRSLIILNSSGTVVDTYSFQNQRIDTSGLPSGLYIILAGTTDGSILKAKIIKR